MSLHYLADHWYISPSRGSTGQVVGGIAEAALLVTVGDPTTGERARVLVPIRDILAEQATWYFYAPGEQGYAAWLAHQEQSPDTPLVATERAGASTKKPKP